MGKKAEFIAVVTGPAQDGCVAEYSCRGEDALFGVPFEAEIGTKIKITFEELDKK